MDFVPEKYNYKLTSEKDDVLLYQKIVLTDIEFPDIIELCYWRKAEIWTISFETEKMKPFISSLEKCYWS